MSTSPVAGSGAAAVKAAHRPKHELTYFDMGVGGRAFASRAALHAAGVEWVDNRVSIPDFLERKKKGLYPTGVPILKLPSGQEVTQSSAILRYAGKMANLYPEDPIDALMADVVEDIVSDIMAKSPGSSDESEKKRLREEYAANKLKIYVQQLDDIVARSAGEYTAGKLFTIADLSIFFFTAMIVNGDFDFISKDYLNEWPRLVDLHHRIASHPVVTNWITQAATQADKQMDTQADAQADAKADAQTDTQADAQADAHTDTQADAEVNAQATSNSNVQTDNGTKEVETVNESK